MGILNGGPPDFDREKLPHLHDHEEFGELWERQQAIANELEELKEKRRELGQKRGPISGRRDRAAEAVAAGGSAEVEGSPQEDMVELNDRIKVMEKAQRLVRSKIHKRWAPCGRELTEGELEEQYEEIIERMGELLHELSQWADAERKLMDELGANKIENPAFNAVPFQPACIERGGRKTPATIWFRDALEAGYAVPNPEGYTPEAER